MRSLPSDLPLRARRFAGALVLATTAGLIAFALTPELRGASLDIYLVAAPVLLAALFGVLLREHAARRRQHRDARALLHANLQLRETAQALLQEARHDPLTGLDNRRSWSEKLAREAQRAARYGGDPAVIMLDIDHFKDVNDLLGHRAGDAVLVDLTAALRASLRSSDTLARLGGDEFAVLLPDSGLPDAAAVAQKLRESVALASLGVTVSLGVAAGASRDLQTLVQAADAALYDAKAAGRNRVVVAPGADPARRRAA